MQRTREAKSLSIQFDVTNPSSQNFTDNMVGSVDNTSMTTAAAAAEVTDDRDADEDDDLSYDEQDSVGERCLIHWLI